MKKNIVTIFTILIINCLVGAVSVYSLNQGTKTATPVIHIDAAWEQNTTYLNLDLSGYWETRLSIPLNNTQDPPEENNTSQNISMGCPELPVTYIVFTNETGIYGKNGHTGRITHAGKDSTRVINEVISVMPAGSLVIKGSHTLNDTLVLKTGVQLVGEGIRSTVLSFEPDLPLKNAVFIHAWDCAIRNLQIAANENVVNLIHIQGNGQRHTLTNLMLVGPTPIISGLTGILLNGTIPAVYYCKLFQIDMISMDIGINLMGYAHAQFISQLNLYKPNIGIKIDTVLCMISNIWGQTFGETLIEFSQNARYNELTNINGESNTGPTITLKEGARYNGITHVGNTGSGGKIEDNSAGKSTQNTNYLKTGQSGRLSSVPSPSTTDIYNVYGTEVEVIVIIESSNTNIVKNGQTLAATLRECTCTVSLHAGERIRLSQINGVSWSWWMK